MYSSGPEHDQVHEVPVDGEGVVGLKLLTFRSDRKKPYLRLGVAAHGYVIDVAEAAARLVPGLTVPGDMTSLLQGGEAALAAVRRVVGEAQNHITRGNAAAWLLKEDGLDFGPAVPKPGKIICVGLNYRRHAEETNLPIPETPVLFGKFSNTVTAHKKAIPLPRDGEQFDYEAELVLVIGRQARNVAEEDALNYVFGYTIGNDFSCRDLQFRSSQWLLGKSFDGWCPLGPYLVTADEIPDPQRLAIRCRVNGELRQDSNTGDMIFTCAQVVSYASRYMTLDPGDVILTGTPEGVIMGIGGDRWLRPGDEITIDIDGIGTLYNVVGQRS